MVILGFAFAVGIYYVGVLDPAEAKEQFAGVHRFPDAQVYFDELYSALLVRPALAVAGWFRWFDSKVIDGVLHTSATTAVKNEQGQRLGRPAHRRWFGELDGETCCGRGQLAAEHPDRLPAQLRAVPGAGGNWDLDRADVCAGRAAGRRGVEPRRASPTEPSLVGDAHPTVVKTFVMRLIPRRLKSGG